MRDSSERYQVQTVPTSMTGRKRLGSYLVDAGLLTQAQIDVALNDQKATGMKFGEVLATRGWVKQKTIEYFMRKIVIPEREALKPEPRYELKGVAKPADERSTGNSSGQQKQQKQKSTQPTSTHEARRAPVSKPLPSIPSDGGVNWVG